MQPVAVVVLASQNSHSVPGVSTEVGGDEQRPIQARRGNFQTIRTRKQILDVQKGRELTADAGAVLHLNAARVIDHHAQHPAAVLVKMSHIDERATLPAGDSFCLRSKQLRDAARTHAAGRIAARVSVVRLRFLRRQRRQKTP